MLSCNISFVYFFIYLLYYTIQHHTPASPRPRAGLGVGGGGAVAVRDAAVTSHRQKHMKPFLMGGPQVATSYLLVTDYWTFKPLVRRYYFCVYPKCHLAFVLI